MKIAFCKFNFFCVKLPSIRSHLANVLLLRCALIIVAIFPVYIIAEFSSSYILVKRELSDGLRQWGLYNSESGNLESIISSTSTSDIALIGRWLGPLTTSIGIVKSYEKYHTLEGYNGDDFTIVKRISKRSGSTMLQPGDLNGNRVSDAVILSKHRRKLIWSIYFDPLYPKASQKSLKRVAFGRNKRIVPFLVQRRRAKHSLAFMTPNKSVKRKHRMKSCRVPCRRQVVIRLNMPRSFDPSTSIILPLKSENGRDNIHIISPSKDGGEITILNYRGKRLKRIFYRHDTENFVVSRSQTVEKLSVLESDYQFEGNSHYDSVFLPPELKGTWNKNDRGLSQYISIYDSTYGVERTPVPPLPEATPPPPLPTATTFSPSQTTATPMARPTLEVPASPTATSVPSTQTIVPTLSTTIPTPATNPTSTLPVTPTSTVSPVSTIVNSPIPSPSPTPRYPVSSLEIDAESVLQFGGTGENPVGEGFFSVTDGGSTLSLFGNLWKAYQIPQLHKGTLLRFEYRTSGTGHIHGVAVSDQLQQPEFDNTFQLSGSKSFGVSFPYEKNGTYQSFELLLDQDFSESTSSYLVFINDHDSNPSNSSSSVSNITLQRQHVSSFNTLSVRDGIFTSKSNLELTLENSTPVTVIGNPKIQIQIDARNSVASKRVFADYIPNSSTPTMLVFRYKPSLGDVDLNGIEILPNLRMMDARIINEEGSLVMTIPSSELPQANNNSILVDGYGESFIAPSIPWQSTDLAFSVRRINDSYTGPAMKVQRSSDGSKRDIFYSPNGFLDWATIKAFSPSGTVRVHTWYDQSPNGRNVFQNSFSNQPIVMEAGAPIDSSRLALTSLQFASSDQTYLLMSPGDRAALLEGVAYAQASTVVRTDNTSFTPYLFISKGNNTTGSRLQIATTSTGTELVRLGSRPTDTSGFTTVLGGTANTNWTNHRGDFRYLAGALDLYINGAFVASNTALQAGTTSTTTPMNVIIGANGSKTLFLDGNIAEILLLSNGTPIDISSLDSNQKAFFNY